MEWAATVRNLGSGLEAGDEAYAICAVDSKAIATLAPAEQDRLRQMIDYAGVRSQKAQGLGRAITTFDKLCTERDQVLYLACMTANDKPRGVVVLGLLKFGKKKLFLHYGSGIKEVEPMCCLDFYVHESCQRIGIGRALMDVALAHAGLNGRPHKVGYDRPSPKLLKFLGKHYGLHDYVPQNNSFVVYNAYFTGTDAAADGAGAADTPEEVLARNAFRWVGGAARAAAAAEPSARAGDRGTSPLRRPTRAPDPWAAGGRAPLAATVPAQQRTPAAAKAAFPWLNAPGAPAASAPPPRPSASERAAAASVPTPGFAPPPARGASYARSISLRHRAGSGMLASLGGGGPL